MLQTGAYITVAAALHACSRVAGMPLLAADAPPLLQG